VITGPGLSFADPEWADTGGLDTFLAACRHAADRSATPVVLVLNEARRLEDVRRGLESGADLVTMSTDHLPFEENVGQTREIVRMARHYGAAVEGELGTPEMGQAEYRDGDGAGTLTDPEQACVFADATQVDLLAVSVGNVHGNLDGRAAIDLPLVKRLAEATRVPLVLHGGSGIAPESMPALIAAGIVKVNVGAALRSAFWMAVQRAARRRGAGGSYIWLGRMSPPDPLAEARLALEEEVKRRIQLISTGHIAMDAETGVPARPSDDKAGGAKGD
jgi:fructose/tagatose bisphosphate aldolase